MQKDLFIPPSTQTVIHGDCLQEMRLMPDTSITHILTDPPYGLHFMGKDWDKFNKTNFDERGNHKFVGDRMRRSIYSGNANAGTYDERRNDEFQEFMFKIGKEALRIVKPGGYILMFGAPRRFHRQVCGLEDAGWEIRDCISWIFGSGFPKSHNFGRQLGGEWEGYGTALKPAWEPIIVAMKPLDGTFKQNAEKWGVAGINIDGCRIGESGATARSEQSDYPKNEDGSEDRSQHWARTGHQVTEINKGRWPANLILDEEAGVLLGEPARFFYCAKASSAERNAGLEGMPLKVGGGMCSTVSGDTRSGHITKQQNNHPTVKPIKLMEYLLKIITPPNGGIVLDPFCGSGSTLVAARNLGINAIGIEKEEEYCEIARRRIQ